MKKILIYGDSNTWGDNFILGERIPDDKQWPNILQKSLGDEFKIIQEGLPGRLAGNDEKEKVYKNGKNSFVSTFRSQAPVDTIIISLGTNDLQIKYNKGYEEIISDLVWYKEIVKEIFEDLDDRRKYFVNETIPNFIYILPVNFDYIKNASIIFDVNSENKRKLIIQEFNKKINDVEIIYFNNLTLFEDGIHLDFNGHKLLSLKVKEKLIMQREIKPELKNLRNRMNLNVFGKQNYTNGVPTIFIANHNCLMDIFYLPAALKNMSVSLISSRLIYKPNKPRQNLVNNSLYAMPIEAHGGAKYSDLCLKYAEKMLYKNIDLSIFPEGAYIDPNKFIYRGHTGAARILFNARINGIKPQIIPVAIKIISDDYSNLDNYMPNNDIVNVYILEPIDYTKYFLSYVNSKDVKTKNMALHNVVDEGMKAIADVLNKEYLSKYIELFPKNNVIFQDGSKVDSSIAQSKFYIDLYEQQLQEREKNLVD